MVDSVGIKYSNYNRPHFKGEVEKVNNTERSFENDKDATEKYLTSKNIMLGLSAIGLVTLGIIGHKNGWFSKGAKTLAKNSSDDAQVNPQNLRVIVETQLDGTKFILETDSKTGKMVKRTAYQNDGNTIKCIEEFDPQTEKPVKTTFYNSDGEKIHSINEFDPQTEKLVKTTFYNPDGEKIHSINEVDPQTGKLVKTTFYNSDGQTIKSIAEVDLQTGNPVKVTYYENEQVKVIIESDPQTEKMIKSTNFRELDGKIIKSVTEYDSTTGKEIKLTTYEPDGVTVKSIETFD